MKKWVKSESKSKIKAADEGSIDLYSLLEEVSKIEKRKGPIMDVKIELKHFSSSGRGIDYDPERFEYNLSWNRLETDKEELLRKNEKRCCLKKKSKRKLLRIF